MRTFRFDKLARDKIPADMQREGSVIAIHTLDDAAYLKALQAKLLEEAVEIPLDDRLESLKELADLRQVIGHDTPPL